MLAKRLGICIARGGGGGLLVNNWRGRGGAKLPLEQYECLGEGGAGHCIGHFQIGGHLPEFGGQQKY